MVRLLKRTGVTCTKIETVDSKPAPAPLNAALLRWVSIIASDPGGRVDNGYHGTRVLGNGGLRRIPSV